MADEQVTPEAAPAAEPAAPVAPALSGGPWQADIEASFTDPQVRANVDAFLRSKVQPRMTQFEQQLAATENARGLWEAFQDDPVGAYQALTAELEQAGLLADQQPPDDATLPPAAPPMQGAAHDPRLEEMYEDWQTQRELAAYDAAVDQVLADPTNQDINRELYHGFVAAADGDFDQAIALYREDASRRQTQVLDSLGISPEQLAELQAARREQAPAVLGGDAGGSGGTPVIPELRGLAGLDRAIERAVEGQSRNEQAPPVA